MWTKKLALLSLLAALAAACGSSSESRSGSGGGTGADGAGASAGGAALGSGGVGGAVSTGGVGTGGLATGGQATGGVSAGGSSTGGVSTGGLTTGGVSTGGFATGGVSTGGFATGGVSTGGFATGGVSTGGFGMASPTGGVAGSGGAATGGLSGSGGPSLGGVGGVGGSAGEAQAGWGGDAGGAAAAGAGGTDCPASGNVTWTLDAVAAPTPQQQSAYDAITEAMDTAVSYYNCYTNLSKSVTAHYEPSVPTADGNVNGSIRFGGSDYMNHITAMHEIAHTLGIGHPDFAALISGGIYTGALATAKLRELTGDPTAELHGDTMHFWPYGLNYVSEVESEQDLIFHCYIVEAIVADMGW